MKTIYARSDDALRNGSFINVITYKTKQTTYAVYMNGDFMGWPAAAPKLDGLKAYTPKEAAKLLRR